MKKVIGIMIAKGASTRLESKNRRLFCNRPLFEWNLEKLINTGLDVFFESDTQEMLDQAESMGASTILRPEHLRGHKVPSVPLFQNIVNNVPFKPDAILNIQANSPNTAVELIEKAIQILGTTDTNELLTFYSDMKLNGSLWGFSYDGLMNYGDPYTHNPDVLLLDPAIDIHLEEEFNRAQEIFAQTYRLNY